MPRILTTLAAFLLLTARTFAADAVVFYAPSTAGYYVRFDDASNSAYDLAPGSGMKTLRYSIAEASVTSLGAGFYTPGVYLGTAAGQSVSDVRVGDCGTIYWTGSAVRTPTVNLNELLDGADAAFAAQTAAENAYAQSVENGGDIGDVTTALVTIGGIVDSILVDTGTDIPATLGTPENGSLAEDIAEGGGAVTIDRAAAQMVAAYVVAARGEFYPNRNSVWVMERTTDGIGVVRDVVLTKRAGERRKLWIDLAALLGRNEGIEAIDSISAQDVTLVDDSEDITGNLVSFDAEGGDADDTATITLSVTTTEDQEFELEVSLGIKE